MFQAEFITENNFGGAMILSLNTDDHKGKCDKISNTDTTFPLTRKVKSILYDDQLWQIEISLRRALELEMNFWYLLIINMFLICNLKTILLFLSIILQYLSFFYDSKSIE